MIMIIDCALLIYRVILLSAANRVMCVILENLGLRQPDSTVAILN